MGRTACTEPQCLYMFTLYLYFTFILPYISRLHFRLVDSTLTLMVSHVLLVTLITEFCASS